jgi:uncharacterized membrane protein YhaH (DUF805 family)
VNYYLGVWKNYAGFAGRARRAEYWQFALVHVIALIVLFAIDAAIGTSVPYLLYTLAALIPGLAVGVRRLHDTDRSGWWLLISLVPLVGVIVLLVFLCAAGGPGANKYGADPKNVALADTYV